MSKLTNATKTMENKAFPRKAAKTKGGKRFSSSADSAELAKRNKNNEKQSFPTHGRKKNQYQ